MTVAVAHHDCEELPHVAQRHVEVQLETAVCAHIVQNKEGEEPQR